MGSYVLTGLARQLAVLSLSHAGVKAGSRIGLAAALLLAAAGSVHDAAALNETKTLSFHHTHSGEDLTVTFKRDGRYDEAALKQLNHFLRDWRSQEQTVMDRRLFDILWEVYRDVDGKQPIQIISSYRSPATNAMLRRRSSGVARASQHMLGHAIDFYIPGVPLEQIRFAGLRLQRGGVGFYPTSGSPFVHLDTGSVRHWPRMTHDQLARVFPDGKTVHLPTDGVPLKNYELAKAEIERRGSGDDAGSKPNFFAALFRSKPAAPAASDEDDEGAPAPAAKPAAPTVVAAAAKPAEPVPTPRAKPQIAAAIQLASADAQIVAPPKPKPAPVADKPAASKPETPADIINARGFWDDVPATPQQATPAQVAALKARQALAAATDPQPTASVSNAALQALAYAPAASPVDRANVVAASAPIPRTTRPRSVAQAPEINSVVGKSVDGRVATATRLSAAKGESIWLKIVMLSPSASHAMSVTLMGELDTAALRGYFVKPRSVIAMGFSDDPMQGLSCDNFSGSATAKLETTSFVVRTAALR
ncbi:ATP-binding protein [Bradyrhizobium yuanmingense]|uniref:Murein endopeptidase K n=1 Tax=Bradyrhizobium yuanmingense TaxID=108015 RepID=A0A0R3C8I4_9BRAD|nr:ATP-binding protein [Bradyrhizobium yuanmingense]